MKFSRFLLSVLLLASLVFAGGCQTTTAQPKGAVVCPFTEITWEDSLQDVTALEGSDYQSYESVYGGTTYTYPKQYKNLEGTIKYMFDGEGQLMCTAWAYSGDTDEDLRNLYDIFHKEVTDAYGESGYDTDSSTNFGDVWYLEEGHIILSVMNTNDQKALQYSYQNPAASDPSPKE